MPQFHVRQNFKPSCPSGGSWYACDSGSNFVGCCESDPCVNSCPDGNLKPASFDPSFYGTFSDQQCPSGSRWYTCTFTDPPFLGCCKTSPCASGCPVGDLTAGFLSSNPAVAGQFLPSTASSSATATVTSSTSASSSSPTTPPASSTIIQTTPSNLAALHATSTKIIVGSTVGGVAALAIIILLFLYCRRHAALSRRSSQQRMGPLPADRYSTHKDQNMEIDTQDLHESPLKTSLATTAAYKPTISRPSHSPQPSYELPSPFVVSPHPRTFSPPPVYSDDLGITSGTSNLPSPFLLAHGHPPFPTTRSELSSREDIAHYRAELDNSPAAPLTSRSGHTSPLSAFSPALSDRSIADTSKIDPEQLHDPTPGNNHGRNGLAMHGDLAGKDSTPKNVDRWNITPYIREPPPPPPEGY